MSKTISNSTNTGVTLTAAYDPLSITSTGTVTNSHGSVVYGGAGGPWQIYNAGLLDGSRQFDIQLESRGTVTNTGTVLATSTNGEAVRIDGGSGSIGNSGSIVGGFDGVVLTSGGAVGNTGTIGGTQNVGVYIGGGAGTVTNSGAIGGRVDAVDFKGSYADRVILDPGAVFNGAIQGGSGTNTLELAAGTAGATGTLSNFPSEFVGFSTIDVDSGGHWRFDASNTIGVGVTLNVYGTLDNAGSIAAEVYVPGGGGSFGNTGTVGANIDLYAGGVVSNGSSSALIESGYGIMSGGPLTVTNAGTIIATGGNLASAVSVFNSPGYVINTGMIKSGDIAVVIDGGAGTVANAGTITGGHGRDSVIFSGAYADRVIDDPGAVFNGTVQGGSGTNTLELAAGTAGATGTLSNFAGGFHSFGTIAVDSGSHWLFDASDTIGSGTVTDAGTLDNAGSIAAEVYVPGGGGSFGNTGTVGANIDLYAGGVVSNGSSSALIESAGYGIFSGGPLTVTNAGTIIATGSNIAFAVSVFNSPGYVINTGMIKSGDIAVVIDGGAGTVANAGTITGGHGRDSVIFSGAYADRVIDDPGAVFNGTVQGGSGTNTLELAAGTAGATGTLSNFAGGFHSFGTIAVDSGAKWELDGALTGTLQNAGLIDATVTMGGGGSVANTGTIDPGAYGVTLTDGGVVSNTGSAALIEGEIYGVRAAGAAATVFNSGTILGLSGAEGGGVGLYAGGVVTNSGVITGDGGFGVYIKGGAGTVTNSGTIGGALGAVSFTGSYADRVIIDPGAVFVGAVTGGTGTNTLELAAGTAGAVGTLSGLSASFVGFGTILVDSGADWRFDATDTVASGTTVTDSGTLDNAGSIAASVTVAGGGSFGNTGTVSEVFVSAGGVVSNDSTSALIEGGFAILADSPLTVTNAGTIIGNSLQNGFGPGIWALDGGFVTNTGTISGRGVAVYIEGGAGTVTNSGTISSNGAAVQFGGSFADRVILDPRAVFAGQVKGGSGTNTLEFAAGAAGATGTLSNFASEFIGFGTILVDAGAKWDFDATDTIASGTTLTDGGALANAGVIDTTVTVASGGDFDNSGSVTPPSGSKFAVTLLAGGTLSNEGLIASAFPKKGQGVQAGGAAATILNSGTISGAAEGVALLAGGSVANSGTIASAANIGVYIGGGAGTVTNSGTIGGGRYAVDFNGGYADRVILDPGAVLNGVVQGGSGTNTLELAAGAAGATGTLSNFASEFVGFGTIDVDSGAKWELDGASPTVGQSLTLAGAGDRLALGSPGHFYDAISGFGTTDELDLVGLAYAQGATATLAGDTLTVVSDGVTDFFTLDDVPDGTKFFAFDDGAPSHGTLVQETACYCRGTRVLTDRGEVAVEDLAAGDLVVTASGDTRPIHWIGRRSYVGWLAVGNPKVMPVRFKAGSLADHVPKRDLWVSPEHAMFLQGSLVPAGLLVNDISIVKAEAVDEVHYFHIELASHDVIVAEGALSETFVDDNSRGMFHNAPDYWAQHLEAARRGAPLFCAPRLEDGFALEDLRERLAARAGRLRADGTAAELEIRGYHDAAERNRIAGWAQDRGAPSRRVGVVALCNGAVLARAAADRYRPDLEQAGIGDGRHGFEIVLTEGLTPEWRHEIELRSAEDWSLLPGSPIVVEAEAGTMIETACPSRRAFA